MGRGPAARMSGASALARIDLPHVQRFRDRHGHVRHYYRRKGWPKAVLPAPGSPGFLEAYAAAASSRPSPGEGPGAGAERTQPGTIAALIVAYYASAEWAELRASTQTGYRNMLDRFRDKHGTKRVATLQAHHLEAIFHAMATTPGAASNLRKRLRRVFRLAVRLGWRADNPVTETEAPMRRRAKQGFTPWSEADIAAFEARWPTGTRERLALALLLYTGQRRSDVVTMGRQHVKASRVHVRQVKTGARLAIRIHPALQREIDAAPPADEQLAFVLTQYGQPFSAAGFTSWFRERAEMAGLKGRTPHGLRKSAGRRLAEAGCTAKQIAAVLGHATLAEVETYTRDADQVGLADAAVSRLGDVPGT